jgi:hypothetical protein
MKLGVLLKDLGPSQLNYLFIDATNKFLDQATTDSIVAFYENLVRPCIPLQFASMQLAEAYGFDGAVIATTFGTAEKMLRLASPAQRFYYCWDLEWLRMPNRSFRPLQEVYGNPRLTLLARTAEHAKIIEQLWNRTATVVADFDLEKILELVK